jgi:hypothetical protein
MSKVTNLAKEFDKRLEKEAFGPLAAAGGALAVLPIAMMASAVGDTIRRSIPEFSSTKSGVQKAINLASKLKVKINQGIIDRFIQKGHAIIPLFDVMQNIASSEINQNLTSQLDSFIRNVSEFINDASAIEQVIKENSTWYEKAGYAIEDWFGMGIGISHLKSFNYLIQQLIPALSLSLSNASAVYNKIMEEVNKVTQAQPESTNETVTPTSATRPAPATKPTSSVNTLFEDFADIGI